MGSSNEYSPEVRERAVCVVLEHEGDHDSQWAAIGSIAENIGCTSKTLRKEGSGRPNLAKSVAQRLSEDRLLSIDGLVDARRHQ